MALHADYAVALSISRASLQRLVHAIWVAGLMPARFEGAGVDFGFVQNVQYALSMSEPEVLFEPAQRYPTLRVDVRGVATGLLGAQPASWNLAALADIRAPVTTLQRHVPKGQSKTPTPTDLRLGFDLAAAQCTAFSLWLNGSTVGLATRVAPLLREQLLRGVRAIPADRSMFTPPILTQIRAWGYAIKPLAIQLTPEALNVGVDVTRSDVNGTFSTKGNRASLVDLNTVSAPRGYRNTYAQNISAGTDDGGTRLVETRYTGSEKVADAPHGSDLAIALNESFLLHMYNWSGRFDLIAAFERSKLTKALEAVQALRELDPPKQGEGEVEKKHKYEVPSKSRMVIHWLNIALEDGLLVVHGSVGVLSDITITTNVKIKLRVVRVTVSGSTAFVMKHAYREGLQVEMADVHIDAPSAGAILQLLGFTVGVLAAPATFGASLFAAALFGVSVDAMVGSFVDSAQQQAREGFSGTLTGDMGLPLGKTVFSIVPDRPPLLELRPHDVVFHKTGLLGWYGLGIASSSARLRALDPGVTDHWPSTRTEPIVIVLDGADGLTSPADAGVLARWTVRPLGVAEPIASRELPLFPFGMQGLDPGASQQSIDHNSAALTHVKAFTVECVVVRPTGEQERELFRGTLTIHIEDRLLRHKPYVRWDHVAFYEGYNYAVGHPMRQETGWVRKDRSSRIHLTDPGKRCLMADRYSPDLRPESLTYLDELPFPISQILKNRKLVCDYCFFGGPTSRTLRV